MGTHTFTKSRLHTTECPACGSASITERDELEYFEYGSGNETSTLVAEVPMCSCTDCGMQFTDERGERARHASVCAHLQIAEPDEIVAVRERYCMNQTEFAAAARIGRASLARWESGVVFQNGSSDSLIYLLGFPENMSRLKSRFENKHVDAAQPVSMTKARFRCLTEDQIISLGMSKAVFELHPGR